MASLLETEVLEYWVDRAGGGRAGGRAGGWLFIRPLVGTVLQRGLLNIGCSLGDGVCALLGVLLDTKAVEH